MSAAPVAIFAQPPVVSEKSLEETDLFQGWHLFSPGA